MSNFTTPRVHTQFHPPPIPHTHPEDYYSTLHLRLCTSYINIQWLVLAASVSYILTNLITTLTDVMAARIPHSREWPVITNKNRWGNCLDANTNLPKIWSVWVCAWAQSQRGCWALWEWEEWGRYQCSFYKDPKANSRSTFIWKSTTSLSFLVVKPTLLLQTGCRRFSNNFTEETGWLRPVLPV